MPSRILMISGYYPPHAPAGAVRPPALVKHWRGRGHDVRVLAVDNRALGATLAAAPDPQVAHIAYGAPQPASAAATSGAAQAQAETLERPGYLKRVYRELHTTPDRYHGWVAPAVAHALGWDADGWRPDAIYTSGPPHRAHVVAAQLARRWNVPWLAELRDLWVGDPYKLLTPPAHFVNARLARRTLVHARAFVAVTEGAAAKLRAQQPGGRVIVAMNGFDPDDFAGLDSPEPLDATRLTIVHAGVIYAGRRDPAALIAALALLPPPVRERVRVIFYHDEFGFVRDLVRAHGVEPQVEMQGLIPRSEMLRVERAADVMLLCRWADPSDDEVIPGKLFEYIGARRPVLSVGSETGEAATIVRAGPFGLVSSDPPTIARQLESWVATKAANGGRLPDMPDAPTRAYTREGQFRLIDTLLAEVAPRTFAA